MFACIAAAALTMSTPAPPARIQLPLASVPKGFRLESLPEFKDDKPVIRLNKYTIIGRVILPPRPDRDNIRVDRRKGAFGLSVSVPMP